MEDSKFTVCRWRQFTEWFHKSPNTNMTKQIFINLPVENVEKSVTFYRELGFSVYPLFTFDDQKCMAWGNDILVMLHSKTFLDTDSTKQIVNTKQYLTPSFSLPVESLNKMNEIVESGLKAGGKEPNPTIEEAFMHVRTIEDLDGYSWGIIYLDLDKFKEMNNR